jgi:hypothetical protein
MLTPRNEVASVTSDSESLVLLRSLLGSLLSDQKEILGGGVFTPPNGQPFRLLHDAVLLRPLPSGRGLLQILEVSTNTSTIHHLVM